LGTTGAFFVFIFPKEKRGNLGRVVFCDFPFTFAFFFRGIFFFHSGGSYLGLASFYFIGVSRPHPQWGLVEREGDFPVSLIFVTWGGGGFIGPSSPIRPCGFGFLSCHFFVLVFERILPPCLGGTCLFTNLFPFLGGLLPGELGPSFSDKNGYQTKLL